MATLALGALGAAAGSALLPSGLSLLGASIAGSTLGSQLGAAAGSYIDNALFGASGRKRIVDGPRLSDLHVLSSTEGAPIPRLYGRARVGGQIIWATALEEEAVEVDAAGGGKGAFSGQSNAGLQYQYYANFAVALCQGEITSIGRVWADNREISLTDITWRLYTGSETQEPDALIETRQGVAEAPAYRGLAYIVFERLPLSEFGNRIPQLSFEVFRAVDRLESDVRGIVLIPGSGEFAYSPTPVTRRTGNITSTSENVHTRHAISDWAASLDELQAKLPNANSVSLVVSWFGDDLRAEHCRLRPLVERNEKTTDPIAWSVAGLTRNDATAVSIHQGRPAYGGTPSDQTVIAAIKDLRQRALSVVFSPFVLMDIPAVNTKPDPYSGASSQPAYPWRGRITVAPAPGEPATSDKTAAAASQLAAFVGTATPADFSITDETIAYTGPDEWTFRRFILHNAHLCKAAGGVDAFVLSSELRGLTTARATSNTFPFVDALIALAADVRTILGPSTKILYAADWSEYFGYQPSDGSGDVYFHLDPLWASPSIDAIGIDLYWPLADWRDGRDHLDALSGVTSVYDVDYLKNNLFGGEGYDWYYPTLADRDAQNRTTITDGSGKPWVFRYKDLRNWWLNSHFNRPGGIEATSPTAWVPQSKPFWFMEIGCPAVDNGANQPNVFVDPKSIESNLPHYSRGDRDDLMQRRMLQAVIEAFDASHLGYVTGSNPVSAMTGQRMVDVSRTHVYCWDARPYPAFPQRIEIWGDGENWRLGHWLNGRAASAPLAPLVASVMRDFAFADYDAAQLSGIVAGLVVDRVMSARDALQPLELAFFFDALESEGKIHFRPRGHRSADAVITELQVVETSPAASLVRLSRAQETDLPVSAKLSYIAAAGNYEPAVAEARRTTGSSGRVGSAVLPLALEPQAAQAIAESWLHETWAARETATFVLPPSSLALEPGDVVALENGARQAHFRVTGISDRGVREIEAQAFDADVYDAAPTPDRPPVPPPAVSTGPPLVVYLDIHAAEGDPSHAAYVAAAQQPWPGPVAIYRSPDSAGYRLNTLVTRSATTGTTLSELATGPLNRLDHKNTLTVVLDWGHLQSVSDLAFLAGANTAAVEMSPGSWEIIQFKNATLTAPATYQLSELLRGQRGSTEAIVQPVPAGARFVLLDAAVKQLNLSVAEIALPLNWRAGPARHNIAASSYTSQSQIFRGRGLSPRRPVHLRGATSQNGDITITWVRQTRTGGDSWDQLDVPVGETIEKYEIEIVQGTAVLRTLTATSPSIVYTAAMQLLDFGALQPAVEVHVSQVSPTYGRGPAAIAVLSP